MKPLKQSTASQTRVIGGFVDDTDFKTPETGLTIANTDIKLSKNGAAAVNKNSGGATALANGMYAITLDATDTDTVGELDISVKVAGALLVWVKFFVVEEAVYDAMYLAAAAGPLQSTIGGRKLDVTATGAAGIDWANVENPTTALDLSGTDIQKVDTTTVNTDMRGTDNALLAASAPTNFGDLSITVTTGLVDINDKTGFSISSIGANVITAASIAAGALDGKGDWNIGKTGYTLTQTFPTNFADMAITVTAGEVTAGNMRGTDNAATEAKQDIIDTNVDGIITTLGTAGDGLTDITINAASVSAILTTQMTEAYAADGTAPTLAQALFLIQQSLHEFAIASTTRTVKKLDGSTTAATFTLDDATNPTSTTRST